MSSATKELQSLRSAPLSHARIEAWRSADWQRLWLAVQAQKRNWRSLALVPAGAGAARGMVQQVAVTLAHIGMAHLGSPIHVADATDVQLEQLVQFSQELERYTETAGQILVALPPLSESVTALSLAQGSDCALLCVVLDKMAVAEAKETVSRVGAKRFIGSVVFRAM